MGFLKLGSFCIINVLTVRNLRLGWALGVVFCDLLLVIFWFMDTCLSFALWQIRGYYNYLIKKSQGKTDHRVTVHGNFDRITR